MRHLPNHARLLLLLVTSARVVYSAPQERQEQTDADKPQPAIEWVDSLKAARQLSADDGRPVIAYFTFDACVWCKRLEKACFFDPDVVALSRKFIWVTVNRDRTPEIPKQLNVSAYPSLLTLGADSENIFRFQSYQEPPEFIENLKQALTRYQLYRDGAEWMIPPTRPDRICAGKVTGLPAPSDAVPGGMTVLDNSIRLIQDGHLFQLNPTTGEVLSRQKLDVTVGDLCTNGRVLYGMTYGWTAGKPIYEIDPGSGKVVREIVTEANKTNRAHGAKGIAWHDGSLFVLAGMRGIVHKVDIQTGEVTAEINLEGTWLTGLDIQGGRFLAGSREGLRQFDLETGALRESIDCHYPLRNVAFGREEILMMEQPVFGFGRKHERIQVWPQETRIYRLGL